MLHKFIKFSFTSAINYFKAMQLCLIGLAMLTTVDFILSIFKVKLPSFIQIVFDFIYKIQSLVYKPDMSVIPVDFTLIVAAIEMMIMAGLIVYILNFIIEFEQIYDKVHKDGERRFEAKFNKQLEKNAKKIESKSNSFAMLFKIELEKVADGYGFEDKTVDVNAKIVEYTTLFRNLITRNFSAKFEQTEYGNLLFFDKIDDCNNIFEKIYEFANQSKENLKQNRLKFQLKVSLCLADQRTPKEQFLPQLNKLLNIAVSNKLMALGNFKSKYETLKEHPYIATGLGTYSLGNDTIEVYTLARPNNQ